MSTHPELVLAVVLVTVTSVQSTIQRSGPAEDQFSLRVSPLVSFDPGFIDIDIRYNPDRRDRAMIIEIDSGELFRSSTLPVGGADARGSLWLRFDGLPAGNYSVHVMLDRVDRVITAGESSFRVVGHS